MADVPNLKQVKDLAEGLLGREVAVSEGDAVNVGEEASMLGVYKEPDGAVGAMVSVDLPLTVFLGAALGLLPPGGAEDMVDEEDPSPAVIENTREFLNVLAHPFYDSLHVHQRLDTVFNPGDDVPDDMARLAASTFRRNIKMEVKGYGSGNISLVRVEH